MQSMTETNGTPVPPTAPDHKTPPDQDAHLPAPAAPHAAPERHREANEHRTGRDHGPALAESEMVVVLNEDTQLATSFDELGLEVSICGKEKV